MDFKAAFDFLRKLSRNNNREWFEKNKETFLGIKSDFEGFVAEVYDGICQNDPSLQGFDPKKLVFRIYRDVRFSKDKKPYKSHLAAGFSPKGKGTGVPGYYLHIQPGEKSFVCAGLFAPDPESLNKIRQEIDYNGEKLKKIIGDRKFKNTYPELWREDALKTAPKGYSKDHPFIEWIKLRSFVAMHYFPDEKVLHKNFSKEVVKVINEGKSFKDFLAEGID